MPRLLVDASALIALANVGELEILRQTYGTVHTTEVVLDEVKAGGSPAVADAVDAGWLVPVDAPSKLDPRQDLDAGESSLLHVAHPDDVLVLDDLDARRRARVEGLVFTGTVGFLVRSAERASLEPHRARDILESLARGDFRMTAELYAWARNQLEALRG